MRRVAQTAIWNFLAAYRKQTGESLPYIELARDRSRLQELAERQAQSGSGEMQLAAQQVLAALQWDDPTTAGGKHAPSPASANEERRQRMARHKEEYRDLLVRLLGAQETGLSERQQLDDFCRRTRLDSAQAQQLETDVRESLGLPELAWDQELKQALRERLQAGDGLSERVRLSLFECYIRRGRLSLRRFEEVLEAELAKAPSAASARPRWPFASVALALSALGAVLLGTLWYRPSVVSADTSNDAMPRGIQQVSGSLYQDTIWFADTTYQLDGVVFVEAGAHLTIEPGTRIEGRFGSALVVTRDAELYARGTATQPTVFTSHKPVGQRRPGDWGGVVLLGNAPVNRERAQIEGLDSSDLRGGFGGRDTRDSCGVLEYARIEFAGHEVFANNELNGLTLGGCGSDSIIRHVQIHRAHDDGLEVFGGTVDLQRILVTGAQDDSLDWDMGWRGRGQFIVLQQHGDGGDNAIEADNDASDHNALPRSAPTLYNLSLIGSGNPERAQRAMTLRRGTGGTFMNTLISGFPLEAMDLRDPVTAALIQTGELRFGPTLVHDIGPDGARWFAPEPDDDDGGFDELSWAQSLPLMRLGVDPRLPVAARDPLQPDFVPGANSPAALGAASVHKGEFWDEAASYLGAFRPGASSTWLDGWTAFPAE